MTNYEPPRSYVPREGNEGYADSSQVFYAGDSAVKVDPCDPAFSAYRGEIAHTPALVDDVAKLASLPAIYLFSNSRSGDGKAIAMAEDGTVLATHWCSHWGYMKHDLHDASNRRAVRDYYPGGYRLVVLGPSQVPPQDVLNRHVGFTPQKKEQQ